MNKSQWWENFVSFAIFGAVLRWDRGATLWQVAGSALIFGVFGAFALRQARLAIDAEEDRFIRRFLEHMRNESKSKPPDEPLIVTK